MRLGRHLRELAALRVGVALSLVLALVAALWSVERISLFPPGVKERPLEIAAASTRVLVDAQTSTVLDLGTSTYDLHALTNRALLVGNVMASAPVRSYIARRAGVDAARLQIIAPVTQDFPRPLSTDVRRSSKDILKSLDEYRINIQVNPTVPVLDIYAEAPGVQAAQRLANGAVDGMKDYLSALGQQQGVPAGRQVHLSQLGSAHGGLVNARAGTKLAILTFIFVFCASCLATVAISRVRRGWTLSGPGQTSEPTAT